MKHEKIVLVGLAYCIGFTTAFIAFGFQNEYGHMQVPQVREYGASGLVQKLPAEEVAETTAASSYEFIDDAVITEEGLFATMQDEMRVVSAYAPSPEGRVAGFHYRVVDMLVSPDQSYLYYCVLLSQEDTTCRSYLYHAASDAVYPVKDITTNAYLETEVGSLEVTWTEQNMLIVSGYSSISMEEPWLLQ